MELSNAELPTGIERKPLTQGGELWLSSNAGYNSVSVWWSTGSISENGHAAACDMLKGNGDWYVNRVIVKPEKRRGQGIGGVLLEELKELVAKKGAKRLIVTPGGYGSDPRKLQKFYRGHGFKRHREGFYYWIPTCPASDS